MYKVPKRYQARMDINDSSEGETIERRIERLMNNEEGEESIEDKPLIYGRPEEGINPNTDIRHDHFATAHEEGTKLINTQNDWKDERKKKREEMKVVKDGEKPSENGEKSDKTGGGEGV